MNDVIKIVKEKLESKGCGGLIYDNECGCELSDLAPCGLVETTLNGFENGCQPGYKHLDPRPDHAKAGDYAIWLQKEAPSLDQWENVSY